MKILNKCCGGKKRPKPNSKPTKIIKKQYK